MSHGTGIAANALAVAPDIEFIGIDMTPSYTPPFITTLLPALIKAVSYNPSVISISWGPTNMLGEAVKDENLEWIIKYAILAKGITVCCACGNRGNLNSLASIPEVISVGGTYFDENANFSASSYASSGILENISPGRQMPDITGLVGQAPNGIYITLPCHSNSKEDKELANGGPFPNGDETSDSDGWLVASGTSSATPQVAGVACLLVQAKPELRGNPALVKELLVKTARDITAGKSANNQVAAFGKDKATGYGLVDAFFAINYGDFGIWINKGKKKAQHQCKI